MERQVLSKRTGHSYTITARWSQRIAILKCKFFYFSQKISDECNTASLHESVTDRWKKSWRLGPGKCQNIQRASLSPDQIKADRILIKSHKLWKTDCPNINCSLCVPMTARSNSMTGTRRNNTDLMKCNLLNAIIRAPSFISFWICVFLAPSLNESLSLSCHARLHPSPEHEFLPNRTFPRLHQLQISQSTENSSLCSSSSYHIPSFTRSVCHYIW